MLMQRHDLLCCYHYARPYIKNVVVVVVVAHLFEFDIHIANNIYKVN